MILGCDAAGVDEDGNEVIVHSVIGDPAWRGDETLDPRRSLLSERHQGTFAERVAVPRRNLVPKPAELSFEEAACLPTAWLTAYRMLFAQGGLEPGQTVLVQGAGGGVATALIALGPRGRAAGVGDQPRRGEAGARAGAGRRPGLRARRPAARAGGRGDGDRRRGDLGHSLKVAAPGRHGRDLRCDQRRRSRRPSSTAIFFLQLSVIGSTMGTRGGAGAGWSPSWSPGPAADRPGAAHDEAREGSPPWTTATSSARSSSPAMSRPLRLPGFNVIGNPLLMAIQRETEVRALHMMKLETAPMTSVLGSSSRASQVASRSTAVSNSGLRSTNSCSRSASQARVTSSSPRRCCELLDAAVGEVHRPRSVARRSGRLGANAAASSDFCSSVCRLAVPDRRRESAAG